MDNFQLPSVDAPDETGALLFTAWIQFYAFQRLEIEQQRGGGPTVDGGFIYNFGSPTSNNFTLKRSPARLWSVGSIQGIAEHEVESIVAAAIEKYSVGDFGGHVVYQATMQVRSFTVGSPDMMHFARILGDQVYFTGLRRLGSRAILEFTTEDANAPILFAPTTDIKVNIFVGGPIASYLTDKLALGMAEIIGAICALALGRVVEVPWTVFPASDEDSRSAHLLRSDESILNLARDHVSLDIFDEFLALGGIDGLMRVRGSLLSYHAALQQASPDVAFMLFVSSLEALIVPRPAWRKDKATKRFIEAIGQLCPDVVDALVNHANVEQAFEYRRRGGVKARRRQLLDQIYMLRSNPTHSGIGLSGAGMFSAFAEPGGMRVALLSDLARGALLKFLEAPRSSLIGHPMFDAD